MQILVQLDATRIIALIGACTGVASLAWNIYTKVTEGPKLRVSAWGNMIEIPAPPGNPKFLRLTVQNVGTKATTITNYTVHTFPNWRKRRKRDGDMNAIFNNYQGPKPPHKLDVGDEVTVYLQTDDKLEALMGEGKLWVGVHHAWNKKGEIARVSYPKTKSENVAKAGIT